MSDNTNIVSTSSEATVSTTAAAKPAGRQKFAGPNGEGGNKFGITNGRGEILIPGYLNAYVQCTCRAEWGFVQNRKENFAFFATDEFLAQFAGMEVGAVCAAAKASPRWGNVPPRSGKERKAANAAAAASAPVVEATVIETVGAPKLSKAKLQRIDLLESQIAALDPNDPSTADAIMAAQREIDVIRAGQM